MPKKSMNTMTQQHKNLLALKEAKLQFALQAINKSRLW